MKFTQQFKNDDPLGHDAFDRGFHVAWIRMRRTVSHSVVCPRGVFPLANVADSTASFGEVAVWVAGMTLGFDARKLWSGAVEGIGTVSQSKATLWLFSALTRRLRNSAGIGGESLTPPDMLRVLNRSRTAGTYQRHQAHDGWAISETVESASSFELGEDRVFNTPDFIIFSMS